MVFGLLHIANRIGRRMQGMVRSYSEQPHQRLGSTRPLPQPQVCGGTGPESPSDTYALVAGLS
jgi:hypothetical protein